MKETAGVAKSKGKFNLSKNIDQIYASLKESLNLLLPNESLDDFYQVVTDRIDNGDLTHDMEVDLHAHYVFEPSKTFRFIPIELSCAFCIQTQRALANGNNEAALYFIAKAKYYSDMAVNEPKWKAEELKKIRSKGGQATSEIQFKAAKEKVIELLKLKFPPDGWGKDLSPAIEEILGDLRSFIVSNFITLNLDELPRTLRQWIKTDPDVSAAYNALSAKTLSKSKPKK